MSNNAIVLNQEEISNISGAGIINQQKSPLFFNDGSKVPLTNGGTDDMVHHPMGTAIMPLLDLEFRNQQPMASAD